MQHAASHTTTVQPSSHNHTHNTFHNIGKQWYQLPELIPTNSNSGLQVEIAATTLSGNSLRQTVRTHCASFHQAAKLVAALLRVVRVTAGLA